MDMDKFVMHVYSLSKYGAGWKVYPDGQHDRAY